MDVETAEKESIKSRLQEVEVEAKEAMEKIGSSVEEKAAFQAELDELKRRIEELEKRIA